MTKGTLKRIVVLIYHNTYIGNYESYSMLKVLSKLGFSPSEIKAYIYLQKTGSSYANEISSRTQLNRTNVYEALERLLAKGVISFIVKNNVKWFEAKSPDALYSLISIQEEELEKKKKEVLQTIKELKEIERKDKQTLEANVFVGKKGLRMIFEEILEEKEPIALLAAELQFERTFRPYFELWHKRRIKNKIQQRSLFSLKFKNYLKKREFLDYRFVEDKYTNPTTTIIYGNICLLIQWGEEPLAIKIKNKDIVKSHLNYFNLLWKVAKP